MKIIVTLYILYIIKNKIVNLHKSARFRLRLLSGYIFWEKFYSKLRSNRLSVRLMSLDGARSVFWLLIGRNMIHAWAQPRAPHRISLIRDFFAEKNLEKMKIISLFMIIEGAKIRRDDESWTNLNFFWIFYERFYTKFYENSSKTTMWRITTLTQSRMIRKI